MSTTAATKKSITKRYTPQEAQRIALEIFREDSDPENIFEEVAKLLPHIIDGTPKEHEDAKRKLLNKCDEARMTAGLENHYQLLDTVDRQYAALLLRITRQIEREFDCTTAAEKMLAEQAAMAHLKVIDHSRRLNDTVECMSHSSKRDIAPQVEALSRQVDRASRQLYTALSMLRQFKQPQLSVNIRNAFVAENQQINATKP
jgi:hypothetical protein